MNDWHFSAVQVLSRVVIFLEKGKPQRRGTQQVTPLGAVFAASIGYRAPTKTTARFVYLLRPLIVLIVHLVNV